MKKFILLFCVFGGITFLNAQQQELEAVTAACNDYIDAFYKNDISYAERSIDTSLRKVGFWYNPAKDQYSDALEMPYDALIDLAQKWNKDGSQANKNSIREVEVLEIADKIAVAKVTAVWGIDYLNLAKKDNTWKIINVLWQSKPKFSIKPS